MFIIQRGATVTRTRRHTTTSDDDIFSFTVYGILSKRSVAANVIFVRSQEAHAGKFRIREIFFSVYRTNLSLRFDKSQIYFYRIRDWVALAFIRVIHTNQILSNSFITFIRLVVCSTHVIIIIIIIIIKLFKM
jgi:hypothetical protein